MTPERHVSSDPEAPPDDVLEQEQEVDDTDEDEPIVAEAPPWERDPEVPEADAYEQALDVPYGDDEY
jgi:hypothetical protein